MNKDYWICTLIIIVIVSVILTVYDSVTLVKAGSIERGSDIQIGGLYRLNTDNPFKKPVTVRVIDIQLNKKGKYYIKYNFPYSSDSDSFWTSSEETFKNIYTRQDE